MAASSNCAAPWRWLPRISLRWLLATMLLCVAWIGYETRAARKQSEAIAELEQMGAMVQRQPAWLPEWVREWTGEDFCRRVESVYLPSTPGVWYPESLALDVTDSDLLAYLPNCRGLKRLDLSGCKRIKGRGLAAVANLPCLESLCLGNLRIHDSDVRHVSGLIGLKHLNLRSCEYLGDEGLSYLASLANLETLQLDDTQVTSNGVRSLTSLPRLKVLTLNFTRVGDDGIESLSTLRQLETLHLYETLVTPRGLRHLAPVESLNEIWYESSDGEEPCPNPWEVIDEARWQGGLTR